jgi:hypothetical protein
VHRSPQGWLIRRSKALTAETQRGAEGAENKLDKKNLKKGNSSDPTKGSKLFPLLSSAPPRILCVSAVKALLFVTRV